MKAAHRLSLVRRLTWGVCLVCVLAFVLQVGVLMIWLHPLGSQLIHSAADSARQLRAALLAVPADQRTALAQALGTRHQRLQTQAPESLRGDLDRPPFDPPGLADIRASLQADGIGMQMRVLAAAGPATGNAAVILFSLPVDKDVWWLEMQVWRPTLLATGTLVLWLGLITAATVVALWWSVHAIARPLSDLASHLTAQGSNLRALPVERFGTRELRTVAQAFNSLVQQVRQHAEIRQQLLAGVSHDLRTPLSRLRLRLETQFDDDATSDMVADLLALEHIVEQFLAYVQGEGHSPQGDPKPLAECVRHVILPYQTDGQTVHDRLQDLALRADPLAVRRLLSNLIDNALHYGKTPITVVLRSTDTGTELQVWDHGPGMTNEEFKAAVQPFVRLDAARTDVGHCGLGLAIATQMAQHLGGSLHLASDATLGFGVVMHIPR